MKSIESKYIQNNGSFDTNLDELRDQYQTMFRESSPRYHLTLTFRFGLNERVAVSLLNNFLVYVNRAILKRRYNEFGKAIKGFVIKEATPSMDNIHFHIIISDPERKLPDHARMDEIIKKKIENVNRTVKVLNQISKYLLQDYYEGDDSRSLEKYLTKVIERTDLTFTEKINAICPIGADPVDFGGLKY